MKSLPMVVNGYTACLTEREKATLKRLGGVCRPGWQIPKRNSFGLCWPHDILCWWCRRMHPASEVATCMAIERPKPALDNGSTSSLTAKRPPWLSQFPELWEFLSKPSYKDGTPRQLGKVSFGLNSAGIQMTLTDPSSSTYCSRNYPTMEDALLAFELGLADGSLTWKASGPIKGRKRP